MHIPLDASFLFKCDPFPRKRLGAPHNSGLENNEMIGTLISCKVNHIFSNSFWFGSFFSGKKGQHLTKLWILFVECGFARKLALRNIYNAKKYQLQPVAICPNEKSIPVLNWFWRSYGDRPHQLFQNFSAKVFLSVDKGGHPDVINFHLS